MADLWDRNLIPGQGNKQRSSKNNNNAKIIQIVVRITWKQIECPQLLTISRNVNIKTAIFSVYYFGLTQALCIVYMTCKSLVENVLYETHILFVFCYRWYIEKFLKSCILWCLRSSNTVIRSHWFRQQTVICVCKLIIYSMLFIVSVRYNSGISSLNLAIWQKN